MLSIDQKTIKIKSRYTGSIPLPNDILLMIEVIVKRNEMYVKEVVVDYMMFGHQYRKFSYITKHTFGPGDWQYLSEDSE